MKLYFSGRLPDPEDDQSPQRIDRLAQNVRHQTHSVLRDQAERLKRLAAEYAHLGSIANELLESALENLEQTPTLFEFITRLGVENSPQKKEQTGDTPTIVEGKAIPKSDDNDKQPSK